MNILSLFGGIETGLIALKELGIGIDNYYSSEIDKYAIQIAKKNHPEIKELGTVSDYKNWNLPKIDLILAGFPCQSFSFAGKQLNFGDERGQLFFTLVEILWHIQKENPEVLFLFENVKMKKEYEKAISEILDRDPILINSALVSAQNRKRLYWCNWKVEQPEDKGILLKDIIEDGFVDRDKSLTMTSTYRFNPQDYEYFEQKRKQIIFKLKGINNRVVDISINQDGIRPHRGDKRKSGISEMGRLMFIGTRKTYTVISSHVPKLLNYDLSFRKLTPIECERLQTLPDNYTEGVSNTQRYKMIGNGWTKDVIKHILSSSDM